MNPRPRDAEASLSLDSLQRIDRLCAQFEDAWRASRQPRIEDYLGSLPGPEQSWLFLELLRLEIELRRDQGETPQADAYRERFSDYRNIVENAFRQKEPGAVPARTEEVMRGAGYEILEPLGRGGMGVVYKARHLRLNRPVALKVILAAGHSDQEHLERFRSEARVVALFQHPNIVQVYEVGEQDGISFHALEFAEGGSLEKRLNGTPENPRESAQLIETLARAAHYAHQQGIVHRDLKPANVLLSQIPGSPLKAVPKIADFGLAKQMGGSELYTQSGEILGTASYMAPEQAAGDVRAISPATDVYALGAILYEMLSGRPPFKGRTVLSTLEQIATQEPVAPSKLQRHVPRDLETVCLKCLEKEPRKRYADAEALAGDLRRFLDGEPIVARRTPAWERGWKWARRRPVEAALAAALLIVAVLGLAGIVSQWRDAVVARGVADSQRDFARRQLYRSSIAAASSALQLNNSLAAGQNLEAAPQEHRNWEWRHLHSQLDKAVGHLRGHEGPVAGATFSPDGSRILSFSDDRTLRLWEAGTGKLISVLRGHTEALRCAAFSPDGKRIASGGGREVRLWDGATGAFIAALRGHTTRVASLAFSPDGTRLVTGESGDHPVYLWDTGSGKRIGAVRHPGGTQFVAFAPAGTRFATGGVTSLRVFDAATAREVHIFDRVNINALAFSPDGTRIVSGSIFPDNKVRLWDITRGRLAGEAAGHQNAIDSVMFSLDGSRIASGSLDQTARLWDAATLKPLAVLSGHRRWVQRIQFNPTGTRLVSAAVDGTLRLWDVATGEILSALYGHTDAVKSVAFSPDGSRILSSSLDGTLRLWDVALLERDGVLRGHAGEVYDAAFSPDGSRVFSAAWDGALRIWNATTGEWLGQLKDDNQLIVTIACSPDGKEVASGSREGRLNLWDLARGKPRVSMQLPCDGVYSLAYSPDGKQLAASMRNPAEQSANDRRLWLLDAKSGTRQTVLRGHTNGALAVRFSTHGKYIVSGGHDRTVRVWDSQTGKSLAVLTGHAQAVRAVAFDAAGTLVASGSDDGTIRLWDTLTRQEVASLPQASIVYSVAFTPDGTRLAAGYADNTIRF